jgi:SPP1 family predicted phage head-tail adaptor
MPQSRFVSVASGEPVIDPGAMRHRIAGLRFQETIPRQFDAAGPAQTWVEVVRGRGAIEAYRGKDVIQAGQTTAQLQFVIATWFHPAWSSGMRVQTRRGTYVIEAMYNVDLRDRVLELICVQLGDG